MSGIFSDEGGTRGLRTRLFRNGKHGGVEWMYAVDWAAGYNRWFAYGMASGNSIEKMISEGWPLKPWGNR